MSEALSLVEELARVPDPRSRKGRRHPLTAILALTVVATLAGGKSLEALAQFGRDQGPALAHALGFPRGKTPTKSCRSNLFRRRDGAAREEALGRWIRARVRHHGWDARALDGKTARGSADGDVPAAQLRTAYVPAAAAVRKPIRGDGKTHEHQAALRLLGVLPLLGKVVTADALFTHRDCAQEVHDRGGDYLVIVKAKQPERKAPIQAALYDDADFSPYQRKQKRAHEQSATTLDKGHGRQETRTRTSTTALNTYLDWPDIGQVFALERVRVLKDQTEVEGVYGITSRTRARSDARALLGRTRGPWGIENRLPYVRDETLGEDRGRVRKGHGAPVLAAIRNACVHLLAGVKAPRKAAATRRLAAHPEEAVPLLFT